jgi:3-dehydroquinate synthase
VTDVRVEAGGRDHGYSVRIESGLRRRLGEVVSAVAPARRWAVIADDTVAGLHGEDALGALARAQVDATLLTFAAGEASKSRKEWTRLTDELLARGFNRDCGVIALGGGVTGDLAGFVAATFMRGIPVVQVPTTLLAMIDASVGGKTGVNAPAGKNLVGAFHAPVVVVVDPEYTQTLPRAIRAQGLAEAIKHGVIRDASYLDGLEDETDSLLSGDVASTQRVVRRSIEIKASVVSADERESGVRKILNFGHTLGHGVEAASEYAIPHGHAVSIGMVAEARMGESLGVTEAGTANHVRRVVEQFGLPTDASSVLDPSRVAAAIRSDKKGEQGVPHWVPVAKIGTAGALDGRLTLPLSEADALRALFGGGEPTRPA